MGFSEFKNDLNSYAESVARYKARPTEAIESMLRDVGLMQAEYEKVVEDTPTVKDKSPSILAGEAMKAPREASIRAWAKPSIATIRAWAKPSEANVKEGDCMVITGNNNNHKFKIGELVTVIEPISGDDDFDAEGTSGNFYVEYNDARFATIEDIEATSLTNEIAPNDLTAKLSEFYGDMRKLLVSKNENYGDSFSRQYDKYGMTSVEMRLNDKFMRLEQLIGGDTDKVGESIDDTLTDIIGYCTLALLKRKEIGGDN